MSVRSRPAAKKSMEEPQLSIRALVVGALALLVGLAAWHNPELSAPVTASLATFLILDRVTA